MNAGIVKRPIRIACAVRQRVAAYWSSLRGGEFGINERRGHWPCMDGPCVPGGLFLTKYCAGRGGGGGGGGYYAQRILGVVFHNRRRIIALRVSYVRCLTLWNREYRKSSPFYRGNGDSTRAGSVALYRRTHPTLGTHYFHSRGPGPDAAIRPIGHGCARYTSDSSSRFSCHQIKTDTRRPTCIHACSTHKRFARRCPKRTAHTKGSRYIDQGSNSETDATQKETTGSYLGR